MGFGIDDITGAFETVATGGLNLVYNAVTGAMESPPPPGPGATEQDIQRLILENLQQSGEFQEMLMPFMLEEMGLRTITSPEGVSSLERIPEAELIAGMTPQEQQERQYQSGLINQGLIGMGYNPDTMARFESDEEMMTFLTPQQAQQYQIAKEAGDYELKALRGELPISPGLQRDIEEGRTQLAESMSRKLGVDWETTTPGIQALASQEEREGIVTEAARRGMMTTGEQLRSSVSGDIFREKAYAGGEYGAGVGRQMGTTAQRIGTYAGLPTGGLNLASAYSGALAPYQQQRGMEWQATQQTAANRAQLISSLIGAGGTAAGMYAGA